jgi:flagellar basal body-associated protein FliL
MIIMWQKLIQFCGIATLMFLLFSCRNEDTQSPTSLSAQIDSLTAIELNGQNGDSLYNAWLVLEKASEAENDSLAVSRVCYNLARMNAMSGKDSAEYYIERALDWIEPTVGNEKEKAMAYQGLGNIWNSKASERQANYYYNKAASLILADTGIDLSPVAKSIMLLSAAQSNERMYNFELAKQMNRMAAGLWEQLPANSILKQRILIQTMTNDEELGYPVDSMERYLMRLRELHQEHPGVFDEAFLLEMNARYYYRKNNIDSTLYFQLLKVGVDTAKLAKAPDEATFINNIYINYANIAASYCYKKDWKNARIYLQKCDSIKKKHGDLIQEHYYIIFLSNKSFFYEKQAKFDSAVVYSDSAFSLQKAFFKTQNTQAVAEMNTLYQLQAKDKSIKHLSENIKISELELDQTTLWLTIAVLLALLLGTYLIILFYGIKQKKLKQKREKLLMEQQLLRTQMEPHFIFNTLSAVQSFIRLDQKDKAIKYINQFSRLLRSSLELSRQHLVPIDEEVETLENYLSLQQMRFETGFDYEINVAEHDDLGAVLIPPMLIQPYVENAILHGIDLQSGAGAVQVNLAFEDDVLVVSITDSGKPANKEANALHRSLSGAISKERLKILGKKASLAFNPNQNGGHTVVLRIPIVQS